MYFNTEKKSYFAIHTTMVPIVGTATSVKAARKIKTKDYCDVINQLE